MEQGWYTVLIPEKKDLTAKGYLQQLIKIEKRVFPKHESMASVFEAELRKRNTCVAVAVVNSTEVIGYILWTRERSEGKIVKLCVAPEYQKRGVGGRLLDTALGCLGALESQRGVTGACERVMLQVDPKREAAVKLYASRGFCQLRMLADYYCKGRDAMAAELIVGTS
ncbi:hypothetical protein GUITHDRAFT_153511, partial [Guillardia theta CCMP2712]